MAITCSWKSNVPVLTPRGVLDSAKCGELKNKLDNLIDFGEQCVVINFEHVSFMKMAATKMLSAQMKKIWEQDKIIILAGANEGISKMLQVTQLVKYVILFDSVKKAINSLESEEISNGANK